MFIRIFGGENSRRSEDASEMAMIEPYVTTIGEEFLNLFYKYLHNKVKQPDIADFGRTFFFELCSSNADYQIHLLHSFFKLLSSAYSEIYL